MWENKDQLLGPGEDADTNAMLWWRGDERWAAYAEGYKEAADILVERVIGTASDQDFLMYPIAFLYRHYLELRLKTLVRVGYALVGEPSQLGPEHKIRELWKKARVVLERVWPERSRRDLDKVEADILEFADKDPKSQAFRYPTANKGKQTLSGLTQVNLRNLQEVMGQLAILLDSAFDGLTEMLRIKRDARGCFTPYD